MKKHNLNTAYAYFHELMHSINLLDSRHLKKNHSKCQNNYAEICLKQIFINHDKISYGEMWKRSNLQSEAVILLNKDWTPTLYKVMGKLLK